MNAVVGPQGAVLSSEPEEQITGPHNSEGEAWAVWSTQPNPTCAQGKTALSHSGRKQFTAASGWSPGMETGWEGLPGNLWVMGTFHSTNGVVVVPIGTSFKPLVKMYTSSVWISL